MNAGGASAGAANAVLASMVDKILAVSVCFTKVFTRIYSPIYSTNEASAGSVDDFEYHFAATFSKSSSVVSL